MSGHRLTRQETREGLRQTLLWLNAVTEHLEPQASGHRTSVTPANSGPSRPQDSTTPQERDTPPLLRHSLWNPWDRKILKRLLGAVDRGLQAVPLPEWRSARTEAYQAHQYQRQLQRSWFRRTDPRFHELAKIVVYVPNNASPPQVVDDRASAVESSALDAAESSSGPGEVQL